jgi:hypothetical protein
MRTKAMSVRTTLVTMLMLVLVRAAPAHHSTANFDRSKEQTITGVVSYFGFTNPHSYIDVDVTDAQTGKREAYKVFAPGRVLLVRYDWLPADLKAGDTVTVTGYPDRQDAHFMYLSRVTFASGKVWQRDQRIPE